jgi:hypothetical protein
MIGEPIELPLGRISKIADALKIANDTAKDLNFQTSWKLARFSQHIEDVVRLSIKFRAEAQESYRRSDKGADAFQAMQLRLKEIEEKEDTIYVPKFKLSEFVYILSENTNSTGKLKVGHKFIQVMTPFIEDDISDLKETVPK